MTKDHQSSGDQENYIYPWLSGALNNNKKLKP